jgi:hypothetical protein
MRAKILIALGCLTAALALPTALRADSCTSAGNLVANCSFGTGDFTDWNATSLSNFNNFYVDTSGSYSNNGDYAAAFGSVTNAYDTISQLLSTTSGASYTLSFWLYDVQGDGLGSDTDFQALWNGTSLLDQFTTDSGAVQYTFAVTGTGNDTLLFEGYNAPSYYYLSDVSVTAGAPNPVPEPSSFWLLGSGLAGLSGMLRRRLA